MASASRWLALSSFSRAELMRSTPPSFIALLAFSSAFSISLASASAILAR